MSSIRTSGGTTGDRQWVAYDLDLTTNGDNDFTSTATYSAGGVTITAENTGNCTTFDVSSGTITCTPNAATAWNATTKTAPTIRFDVADLAGEPGAVEEWAVAIKLTHPSTDDNAINLLRQGTAGDLYFHRLIADRDTGTDHVSLNQIDNTSGATYSGTGSEDSRTIGLGVLHMAGGRLVAKTAGAGSDWLVPDSGSLSTLTQGVCDFPLAPGGTNRFSAQRIRLIFRAASGATPQLLTVSGVRVYVLEAV